MNYRIAERKKLSSLVWVWIVIFIIFSILIIASAYTENVTIQSAIIAQIIMTFTLAAAMYGNCFAATKAGKTIKREDSGSSENKQINAIKTKAKILLLRAGVLSSEYESVRNIINICCADIKTIHSLKDDNNDDVHEVELSILETINNITMYCGTAAVGGYSPAFENEVWKLRMLIEKRKSMQSDSCKELSC
ncbi:MAG: hypothetical protein LBV68_00365 [Spirochaetaceae bacterium]|jgi:hypothetical protein|nr:hypothetical protein [Spirochaetaceae bacterium]